jgi:hypothetical protein
MFIRYQIAPVGEKHGWKQGSADCWFYAAKSLLRFYGLAEKNQDHVYAHLQLAKLIRWFINRMVEIHGEKDSGPMETWGNLSKWVDQEISKIDNTRSDIVRTARRDSPASEPIKRLLASQNLWTTENILELTAICKQVDDILGPDAKSISSISEKRYLILKIGRAVLKVNEKSKRKTLSTGEIFASAFPPSLFRGLRLTERTAESLYGALVDHGPLWTEGDLATHDAVPHSRTTHLPEGDLVETYALADNFITDAKHAVTVYGVNTQSKMVEYADPHDFRTPRRVQASVFFEHLRAFEFDRRTTHFLAVALANSEDLLKQRRIMSW